MIHPSPALVVRADITITDAITLMKKHEVGSLLVMADDQEQDLVGVFTERDLLQKCDLIDSGNHWKKPIRTVMSSPVVTLDIAEIDSAANVMLQHHFRHLPIVMDGLGGKKQLIGVISIRDVLRSLVGRVRPMSEAAKSSDTNVELQIFTKNAVFYEYMKRVVEVLRTHAHVTLHSKLDDAIPDSDSALSIAILDLDEFKPAELEVFFKSAAMSGKSVSTVICFDKTKANRKTLDILARLKSRGNVGVFAKPVNILALSEFFSR